MFLGFLLMLGGTGMMAAAQMKGENERPRWSTNTNTFLRGVGILITLVGIAQAAWVFYGWTGVVGEL
ncbi:MAG: hypothetical protein VX899_02095 [Myxococcota bacterium]|nr:hypothetical protein [Myxococcota bacterium]